MIFNKAKIKYIVVAVLLMGFATGCSPKGVHMPRHRKKSHCNCPTFSEKADAREGDVIFY